MYILYYLPSHNPHAAGWLFFPCAGTGEFEMGEMHGEGVLTFKNHNRYEGHMKRNMMHGE